jgi:hypothetical protein
MFGFFSKTESKKVTEQLTADSPFYPIIDVGQACTYVTVEYTGTSLSMKLNTKTIQESKFALEEIDLLKKTAQSIKKETTLRIKELRLSHSNRVANRGAMVPGGGKIGTVFRYLERSSRASERGEVSSAIKEVEDNIIKPMDQLLLGLDKYKLVLKKEILTGVVG